MDERRAVSRQFGQRLRELRLERGWSQIQFAARVGKHWSWVARLERGESCPGLGTVLAFAEALEIDPSELVRGITLKPEKQGAS